MTKEISIFRSIFKNTARFGKVNDYKNEGMQHIRGMDRSVSRMLLGNTNQQEITQDTH
jgi:hypothetical protein